MQTLELKSIYILSRNCSSSYTEHNKIGFKIFGFFYDVIWTLQVAAKTLNAVKKPFCEQAPGKIEMFIVMPLVCAQALGKKTDHWVLRHGGGGILARCSPERAGEEEERVIGVAYDRLVV
jgi:hypothetical protein